MSPGKWKFIYFGVKNVGVGFCALVSACFFQFIFFYETTTDTWR